MDESPYSNIMSAIAPQEGTQSLSALQQVDNYDFFSKEIMGKGVYLPDLVKQVESLKAEVESLKANAKAEVDTELFEVMESKVRDAPAVVDARKAMEGMRETVLDEMCRNDPRYRDAVAAYRKAVADAYRKQE